MDLETYLSRHQCPLPALAREVDARCGLRPADRLLAVGSLVEGIGTSKSDVDLLLLRRDASPEPGRDNVSFEIGTCLVDVTILPKRACEDLLERLRGWCGSPWDLTYEAELGAADLKLLHRLSTGLLLPASDDAMERPDPVDLAQLKLHIARHNARTIQVDMAGHRDGMDLQSLTFAAQDLLGHAIDALLAGNLITNPLAKWRSRLLERLDASWDAPLAWRHGGGLSASATLWRLHRAPPEVSAGACFAHASRIAAFARAIFSWAENRLVFPSVELTPPGLSRTPGRAGERLPDLEYDVDFSLAGGGTAMARLNAFGRVCRLSEDEFVLALMCDGETAVQDAAHMLGGAMGGDPIADALGRMREAGLFAPPRPAGGE